MDKIVYYLLLLTVKRTFLCYVVIDKSLVNL